MTGPSRVPFYRYYFDILLEFLLSFFYKPQKNVLPEITNPLITESAVNLASKIQNGELTSTAVVKAFIERCKSINEAINAVVGERYLEALTEARDVDTMLKKGHVPKSYFDQHPLLGVPFTVTESLSCSSMSRSLGLMVQRDVKSNKDSEAVKRMKTAGGILIAVTNVSQLNFWVETYNPVYGMTRNPYDLSKSPGGSSGGEAALIAACGSPIGLGLDVGGDIRIPANRCGIFAFKPTGKLIPVDGHPMFDSNFNTIAIIGPLAKFAEDLELALEVLTKSKETKIPIGSLDSDPIRYVYSLRSYCGYASPIRGSVENQMRDIVQRIIEHQIVPALTFVEFEETVESIPVWGYKISREGLNLKRFVSDGPVTISPWTEAFHYLLGKRDYCLYTIYNLLGLIAMKSGKDEVSERSLNSLKQTFMDLLDGNSVLLFPSEPLPVSYPYLSLLRPYNHSYAALWNALEFPVVQVPIGKDRDGMPYGVQVVAAPHKDRLCITVARALELHFGGYRQP